MINKELEIPVNITIPQKEVVVPRLVISITYEKISEVSSVSSFLTEREKQILQRIVDGENSQKVGEKLFLSPRTVYNHAEKIINKLRVKNRTQAAVVGLALGIVGFPRWICW